MSSKKLWLATGVALGIAGLLWVHRQAGSYDDAARVLSASFQDGSRAASHRDLTTAAQGAMQTEGLSQAAGDQGASRGPGQPASRPGDLFHYVARPADAARWEAATPYPADEFHYVRIDALAANGKQSPFWQKAGEGRVTLTLPDGRALAVRLSGTRSLGANRFSSEGEIEGQPYSTATFAFNEGEMSALVDDLEHGAWQLRALGNGLALWFKVNHDKIPGCGVDAAVRNREALALLERRAGEPASVGGTVEPPPTILAETIRPELRILFAYTDAVARSTSAGALQTQFDLAIATLNGDFTRSQIPVTAVFAGSLHVPYANDDTAGSASNVQSQALTHVTDPADGYMDTVHPERDRVGADVVCLVQNRADTESAGIAYVLDEPGRVHNPTRAFCVVGNAYIGSASRTFSHEIGHTLGCGHHRDDKDSAGATTGGGAYPYSHGYRFTGADGVEYRTIMAYSPGMRLAYFSNPDVTAPSPVSRAVGIAAGQTGEADNARTIRETAFEVGGYRLSLQSPANLGTLINVSTRAFVSTGSQQLIGGFILSGTQKKRLLIRGIGPTLAQLNVSGVLADPRMRLMNSAGSEIAQNDNWQASDASIMSAAGAFPLPNGSRDSVLVVNVDPGAYTVLLDGVGGATGTGLIEAYEIDRGGTRLANIATRGFADRARPMIAGFVVVGEGGKTKRMLIRALGPTLLNLGVTDAMDDPTFTLYDVDGRKLLYNDDWSSGSEAGNDYKPFVRIYAEKQISATGNAPSNRRDSAVMVDLLPGAYTAVVQPFEELPDQPQKPGVALVDVFEINP